MSTLAAQRTAIVSLLATIDGIGRVHEFERYGKDTRALLAHYIAEGDNVDQLRGWFVRRVDTHRTSPALGRKIVTHSWHINGRMALADDIASELIFDGLLEAISDAFEADETLGGVVGTTIVNDVAGIQVIESGPVMFGGVLCHAATLLLMTQVYQ